MSVSGKGRQMTLLEAKLRARVEAAEVTVETYIERIPRDDQAAEEELEAFAIEGPNSGEPVEDDERYWAEKRQRLIDRDQKTGTRVSARYVVKPKLIATLTSTPITLRKRRCGA